MRRTYAYNSITIGFLVGMLVYASTNSGGLAALACAAVSVVGFIVIRLIENAISRGVDKAADKVSDAWRRRQIQRSAATSGFHPAVTRMPAAETTRFPAARSAAANSAAFPPAFTQRSAETTRLPVVRTAPAAAQNTIFCPYCGAKIQRSASFCPFCGSSVGSQRR